MRKLKIALLPLRAERETARKIIDWVQHNITGTKQYTIPWKPDELTEEDKENILSAIHLRDYDSLLRWEQDNLVKLSIVLQRRHL